MTEQELLKDISRKEIEYRCYEAKVDGISIYSMLRRKIRGDIYRKNGIPLMELRMTVKRTAVFKNMLVSAWHLAKLYFSHKQYKTVFYAFPRTDKIHGIFMDKFTDPIIELCQMDDYIILDHGRAGEHPKPRMHNQKLIYWEALQIFTILFSKLFYKRFEKRYRSDLKDVTNCIKQSFDIEYNYPIFVMSVLKAKMNIEALRWLFSKVGAINLVMPARHTTLFIAAHLAGVKIMELQHGITYGETDLYSGYRDSLVVPDYFLAFGNNKPLDVYGINESRIVNIGWALRELIKTFHNNNNYGDKDVLVISDPEVSLFILNATLQLAQAYPESTFYVRPHPHEKITQEHWNMIEGVSNIKFQDNHINITETLDNFTYVVGENSTVVYEALSEGKRVGRLFFEGLHPKYLTEDDKDCFWEIYSVEDFDMFLKEKNDKKSKTIYSPFDKEKFLEIISC